jgi:AraC-like DNA-binding protein
MKYQSHLALDEQNVPPSSEWEPPANCWCFVRLDEGQGYWLGDGEARELNAGDVLALLPARHGMFRASQLSAVRLFHFRFCPDLMSGLLTMAERQCFDRLGLQPALAVGLLPSTHPVAIQFAALCENAETQNGLLLRCRMLELVGRIYARELAPPAKPEAHTLSATKRIKVLLEHLTEEEFLNASMHDLAAYCGCSVRHFSRLFLQHFSVSLRSRQTEMRLLKARRLLSETDSRVMTVAASCGYRHLGVFNALFKKRFAMTPTEWRRTAETTQHSNGCLSHDLPASANASGRKRSSGSGSVVTEK